MAKKKYKRTISTQRILSSGVLLLGLIFIIESVISILVVVETTPMLAIEMLVINWLYLSIKTIAGVLFLTYGLFSLKK